MQLPTSPKDDPRRTSEALTRASAPATHIPSPEGDGPTAHRTWLKLAVVVLLVLALVATSALALASQRASDPLAEYRAADGSLHIPGRALTPGIQRLLFGGSNAQLDLNLSYYAPTRSAYATMSLVEVDYRTPNPNAFTHPARREENLAAGAAHLASWFLAPYDWGAQLGAIAKSFFSLFTMDARAVVAVDTTTVADVTAAAPTCSTTQTAGGSDDAILVMLSERGTTAFLSVTYGSVSLTLIAGTAANGGTLVRTEIWGFVGSLPAGLQTMTATLTSGNARMTCATILLQGVKGTGSFINATSNSANSTNATVTLLAPVTVGNLAFAVTALQNGGSSVQPTAVAPPAVDLYGVAVGHCTGGGAASECAAGADMPNPGTAVTWTNPITVWVVSAVEVVAIPTCNTVGGGNCYRIGAGGTWTSTTNWSNSSGGPSCNCSPLATDNAIFDASTPTGTVTLAGPTSIASLDMTGFTGTLDTATNYALTVTGNLTIQGSFLARGSTIAVSGNVAIVGATTSMTLATSAWTVNGAWTNNSTSASWNAGTSTVTIRDAASGTLTFGNLSVNEFNNLTLDATVASGLTYTMATNGLRMGGTLLVQNSAAGATGSTVLDTSASNLVIVAGALTLSTLGAADTRASSVTVNGSVTISAATAYLTNAGGSWTVTGAWSDLSTSASWSFAAAMTFRSTVNRTMTFGPQAGNEFAGAVTFDTTVTTAVTYAMATNALDVGGSLTVQNSAAGATGAVTLDTSAASLAVTAGGLALSTLGTLNTRASTITINGAVTISAGNAYVTNTGGSWVVSGAWTGRSASASWSFAAAMTFRAAASQTMIFTGSNLAGNEFTGAVTFDTTAVGGVTYTMAAGATGDSSLKVGGALAVRNSAGGATAATILDTSAGNYGIAAVALTLGNPRGALRTNGSSIAISGAVIVTDANSYIVFGSGVWTVAGSWTNASTFASWSPGTGTMIFKAAANATMTFGAVPSNEFNAVTFDTTVAGGVSYAMATNGLRVAGVLTVQNTAGAPTGNVVLSTSASNLPITAGAVVLGTRGTLTANGSTITVNGSWTSTAVNHAWNPGTSTVVFAATGTLTMGAGESFNNLTQSAGTTTLGSSVTVSGATTVNGTLDTSVSNFALTLQSSLSVGATGVLILEASTASTAGSVTIAPGGAVRFTGAGTWTINGSWTNGNTTAPAGWAVATSTVRIVDAASTTLTFWTAAGANEFYNLTLDASVAVGLTYTQTNALQTAGVLTVQDSAAGATGAVVLDASAANYGATLGGLNLGVLGAYASRTANVTVSGNVAVATTGYITSTSSGTWNVTGAWTNNSTSASWSFAGAITFRSAVNQTMRFKATPTEFGGAATFDTTNPAGVTYTMATSGLAVSGLLTVQNSVASPTGNTILDTSASNLGITAGSVTLATNGTLLAEGSSISIGGNWTVTAANASFVAGASTVTFTAAATINMTQAFNNLTIAAGTVSLASNLTVTATLTVSGGVLAKGTSAMTLTALALSGGAITSASGSVSVSGNVSIASAASYIAFGSETWTVGGSWSNASTSASWSAGTATVVFNASTGQAMIFMAGSSNEFYNLTFNSGSSTVTFTMGTNGLRVANLLTVQGGTGTTTVSTSASNLPIAATSLVVTTGGALVANGSTVTVASMDTTAGSFAAGTSTIVVNASGGTVNVPQTVASLTVNAGIATTFAGNLTFAGALTLTASTPTFVGNLTSSGAATIAFAFAAITIAGSWDTSSATGFMSSSSSVAFTGASKTVRLAAGQSFAALSVSGTLSQLSQLAATSLTISAGSVTKGTNPLTVNGNLTLNGGGLLSTSGSVTLTGSVNVSSASSYIQFGSEAWTVGGSWTNASTSASWSAGAATVTFNASSAQTMTFAGSNLAVAELNNVVFDTSVAGGVTYTLSTRGLNISGNLTIRNTVPSPTGNTILSTSAANLPITAAGTITVAATGTLTGNGSTITFGSFDTSAGTFNVGTTTLVAAVTGGTINAPQALNNLSVNASVTLTAASNLVVSGTLTVNGLFAVGTFALAVATLAALSGGITGGASGAKTFSGNVAINAAGYLSFGGAPWTFAGTWTNNSTSASWSPGSGTVTFSSAAGGTMTFAGANLTGNEFTTAVFASSAATAQAFTMAARPLNAGAVQVNDAASTTTLDTSASNLAITATTLTLGAGGVLNARGSTITVTSIDASAGSFAAGTSTVVVSGSSGSVNVPQSLYSLTVNPGVSTTFTSDVTWSGTLTLTSSTPTFNGNVTSSGAATITFASATISVAGSWSTASAASFTSTSSSVTLTGAARTVRLAAGQAFEALTVTGTLSQLSPITASSLAISTGSLTKGANTLTVTGTLSLTGGALISTSGAVSVGGNVNITSASSYIFFGSEAWTVGGAWTNASTSASWSAGTATVTFAATSAQTMTFAGANLPGNEFSAVAFNAGASAVTYTLSTRGLSAGSVTVQGGTAVTILATANLPLTATALTVGANGSLAAGSSTIAVQSINTSAGAFAPGTSTIMVNASSGTVNVTQAVYNLTVNAGITTTVSSSLTFSGTLTMTSATVTFGSDLASSGATAAISFGGSTLSVSGSWNTSSVSPANFGAGASTVTFSGTAKSITISSGSGFAAVIISGTVGQASQLTATSLTVASGSLTKGANTLTVNGSLTLSGGALTSTSGSATVAGSVSISSAASYIAFGSETWTITGIWTNASTSASWSAGTGSVVLAPPGSGTYTFGNLAVNEFNNLQLNPTAAATYTMAANALRWGGNLTLNANATLVTSGLSLNGGALAVGNAAVLTANASAVSVTNVTMTGGTSGAITLTTGSWTVSGNWDTSGAGSTFSQGSSSVTLAGAAKTVKLLAGQQFAALSVSGTVSLASDLKAASLTVTGTLTKTGFSILFNGLTAAAGTITDGAVSASNVTVTDNDPTAYITISTFSVWTANLQYAWTHTDSKTTDTITFTIGGQTGSAFNVYKNGTLFTGGSIVGGNIVFTMLGSDPNVVVNASGCGGNSRYWILGTGSWSQTSHWASASGGVGGCSIPGNPTNVFFDANSGAGTVTVDVNTSFASLNTTGSSIATIALGANGLSTSGSVTLAAGTFTLGTSAGTGLTVGGSLSLSGSAVLDGSGGASVVNVSGSATVSSATAYMRMGSGTWTVSGAWSNASTSLNWSAGTGTVVFNAAASQTMTFAGAGLAGPEFNNVTFNSGASTVTYTLSARGLNVGNLLTIQGGTGVTTLDLSASNLPLTSPGVTVAANGVLNGRGSALSISGNWDSHLGTFAAGTSTVTLSGAAKTVSTASAFATLVVPGTYAMAIAVSAGSTTISGALDTTAGSFALSVGDLNLTGTLSANASAVAVSGNWDSHLGTFAAGTSTVTMSGSSKTLNTASAFASLHITGTVTLAAAVAVGTTLTVDTNGTLDTSTTNYALSAVSLIVGATGTLVGEGSTITVTSMDTHLGTFTVGSSSVVVNASSGTINIPQTLDVVTVNASVTTTVASNLTWSGTLTLGNAAVLSLAGNLTSFGASAALALNSATITVSGNWDTSATAGSFNAGTSSITLNGAAKTFKAAPGQLLNSVTVSGTVTLSSTLEATSITVSGTLTKTSFSIMFNSLTVATGSVADGAVTATNFTVTNSEATAVTTISAFNVWSTNVQYGWTHTSSPATTTITFTITAVTASVFNVTKDGVLFTTGSVAGGEVQFAMLGSDPVVLVTLSGCTGVDAYWVLGAGNWTDPAHWATSSGGVGGCSPPLSTSHVHVDANSGSGIITVNLDASIAALDTTGSTIAVVAIGTHGFSVSGNVIHAAGTLSIGASLGAGLTVGGSVTLSGNAVIDGSGGGSVVSVSGGVTIASPTAYLLMGSGTWTFDGAWSNSSTSASWSSGTGTVVFSASSPQTMTFAALPANAPEFYNVIFNGGSSAPTFTMSANALRWSGTLTIQGGMGSATLATGDLGLSGGVLVVGNGGQLSAGASPVDVSAVTMTGGASESIALTTGAWTVGGNWDTSGAGSILSAGSSTITFTGISATINLGPGQSFSNVAVAGRVSLLSTLTAASLAVDPGAVLTKTGWSVAFNALTETGAAQIVDGAVTVTDLTVANSDPANLTTITGFVRWTMDGEFTWTHSSTVATSTLTFTIGGNTSGNRFSVTKDGAAFTNGLVDASGRVIFTMLGSDPVVDVIVAAPCGGVRYWVGGPGTWSQTAHWSAASGGAGGCPTPVGGTAVIFDALSGSGTATLNQNASFASLDTTGFTGTIAVGTFNVAIGGNLSLAGGMLTLGASSGTGLTVGGNLAVSGSAVIDGSAGASIVGVAGNVAITSAAAYIRMGSGIWTVGGSWSNASTSASWAAGTGMVFFNAATGQTMTFGGLTSNEFYNVSFASGAVSGTVTFTMGGNPLRWAGTLGIGGSAGSTTALATADLPLVGGSLIVGDGGILLANASAVAAADVRMNGGASGTIILTSGAWVVSGTWDTSGAGSVFTRGTSTVTMSGAGATLTLLGGAAGFYDLAISGRVTLGGPLDVGNALGVTGTLATAGYSLSGSASLTISGGGALVATNSSIAVSNVTMNDATATFLSLTTGTLTVSGSWDTSGANSTFTPGTSTVALVGAAGTITLGTSQAFASIVVSGLYALGSAAAVGSLSVAAGGLAAGAYPLTISGDVTLSGGRLTSASGTVSIAGNVAITTAGSYIAFGSGSWTISGAWTNASTSASWDPGTATVTFNGSSPRTIALAGTGLGGNEFYAVVFDAGAASVAFTLAGSALVAHAITIQGGSATTTVDTSSASVGLTADSVIVASNGSLVANSSLITIRSVDTTAGSFTAGTSTILVTGSGGSVAVPQAIWNLTVNPGITTTFSSAVGWGGALTLTGSAVTFAGSLSSLGPAALAFPSATISIAGSWNTTSATLFSSASSTVTFTGVSAAVSLSATQRFATLIVSGNVTLGSDLTATTLTVSVSAVLTKTGRGLTFNRLTVNGTIADGSVSVTNLSVLNDDGTALVTVSVFSAWSVGSHYAWTHTSSETSQTISWVLRGLTPGDLYRVTKDGSDFDNGVVMDSGQIVIAMLGSDPAMEVFVTPPPVAAWWQAPYFLALPPMTLLVVIAMFAQRRRWRPTKAFLVDERGQLLREFTLDPSCTVTYEQAAQAGALDAHDKDVKVAKYHARAVRGDALAIVLLAYGPINLEEVEFAREILVNIQDKFEDGVKARLEETRATEANLAEREEKLVAMETDLRTRSESVTQMSASLTTTRTQLDEETETVHGREQDITEREEALAAERTALETEAREVQADRKALEDRLREVGAREEEADRKDEALSAREADLSPKEAALAEREATLADREGPLPDRERSISDGEAKLAADREALVARSQELEQRDANLREEAKALDELSVKLDGQKTVQDDLQAELERRASEVERREAAASDREAALDSREQTVAKTEGNLAQREQAVAAGEEKLAADREALVARSQELEQRDASLQEEDKSLDELSVKLAGQKTVQEALRAKLERRQADVERREAAASDREAALDPREQTVGEREDRLAGREQAVAAGEEKLAAEQSAFASRVQELERQEAALQEEGKALDELSVKLDGQKTVQDDLQAELERRASEVERREADATARESALDPREQSVAEREGGLGGWEKALDARQASLTSGETSLAADVEAAKTRQAELEKRASELDAARSTLDTTAAQLNSRKETLDAREADLTAQAEGLAKREHDLESLKENLGPREATILRREEQATAREKADSESAAELKREAEQIAAKALELQRRVADLEAQEAAAKQRAEALEQAGLVIQGDRKAIEAKIVAFESDVMHRREELDAEGRGLGEQRLRLQRERDDFEAMRSEKSDWIASKDIELEAREQSLAEKEAAIRAQGEENGRQLAELARREEALEIESAKLDRVRGELDVRKGELASLAEELDARTVELRKEEARKGEELQQWQATLESEQGMLKDQKERFEKEMTDLRESWAGRMIRVEQREDEIKEREAKIQTDVEWIGRNESELRRREKALSDANRAASEAKAELERLQKELERRALEVESQERGLREEAAQQAMDLTTRSEAVSSAEAEFAGFKAQTEQELATKAERLLEKEEELRTLSETLEARAKDIEDRGSSVASGEVALRNEQARILQDRADLQALAQQIEAKQLELAQAKDRQDAEAVRLRDEGAAMRESLAAKEADLRSERERLERESAALQEKLGAKAKEMATREKAVAAREDEMRAEEQEVEARVRDLEGREQHLAAGNADLASQAEVLARKEKDQSDQSARFNEMVKRFESEAETKRKDWESLQASLKSQEAQISASAEARQTEIAKRMQDLAQREQALHAGLTQLDMERSRLEGVAKTTAAKQADVDAASGRAEKATAELRAKEDALLRERQAFETERNAWSVRRAEELKHLEATRDAAGEQTQQAERLIEEAQRRAFVATEAEKSSRRQADELEAQRKALENRRGEIERAERDLQAQMVQLQEASQKLAARENEMLARANDLNGRETRIVTAERANASAAEDLKNRRGTLDQESARLTALAAELDRKRSDDEARRAATESRVQEVAKKEQNLSTELQRADNLMEDLARKEAVLDARDKSFAEREAGLLKQEETLATKDHELMSGMQALERMRGEQTALLTKTEEEQKNAAATRKEAESVRAAADKLRAQADAMQAEVAKNMRFLQKKALDVLDREEKIRARETKADEAEKKLAARETTLETKERTAETERGDAGAKLQKAQAEVERLKAKLAETEKGGVPSAAMEDWKRDIDNRVKIIQRKALELLDREEKMRKKEEELRALEEKLKAAKAA